MHKFAILACAVGALVSGCVSTKSVPLAAETRSAMNGQTITHTTRPKPDFAAMTPAKATLGIAGSFMMLGVGNGIVRDNNIEDPASAMSAELTRTLSEATGATVATTPIGVAGQSPADISKGANGARYIVDVATTYWGYLYQPADWAHYNVLYSAKLRIIDTSNNAIVGEGFCHWRPAKEATLPTGEELLANNAAEVKSQLDQARQACTAQFKAEVIGGL